MTFAAPFEPSGDIGEPAAWKPEIQGELPLEMLSGASHAKMLSGASYAVDELTMYRWREERGQRSEPQLLCRVKSMNWPGQQMRLRSRNQ